MKTTKIYLVVCLTFLLTQFNAFAQYNGGNSNGTTVNELSVTSCSFPSHFYAYLGGINDGSSVDELSITACGTAPFQFAYLGGTADGAATEEASITACGIPPSFYAYFGGSNDGTTIETLETTVCPFPPSFYAYFGGDGNGFTVDKTAPICPTQPPVASFIASSTSICVGQSVTFTDTSTNIPSAWTWTFTGGTPNSSIIQNPVITYNTAGSYAVTLLAANFNGTDTKTITGYITVTAYPTVQATTPASRCDAGTVTLGATASAGTLSWYANATGGIALGTGTSFITPSITATTTYYVETVTASCNSVRTAVIATVNTTPSITATTPASRCDAGSVVLNATSSAGNTIWYANAAGGTALATTNNFTTPSISVTTNYYVEAVNGSCVSGTRTAVVATINPSPTITSTTPATICSGGTFTISATASAGSLSWYYFATGGIAQGTGGSYSRSGTSSTTTFYVQASNGTCQSARIPVVVTVISKPVNTSGSNVSRCGPGSVSLNATFNSGTVNWYDSATGGTNVNVGGTFITPSLTTTTTYYVESYNGTCSSVRTPINAVINAIPTVTSTTPGSRCGTGSVVLNGTTSAGSLFWYTVPSGGTAISTGASFNTPSISVSTTFYVEAVSGVGCISTRISVLATVDSSPIITSTTPASRCDSGTVTLAAVANSGILNWYNVATGGSSLSTGTSFLTPSLSTTTTYYVDASNASCTSVRIAVLATVNTTPTVTATDNSRCDTGTVILSAAATSGTLSWYANASGGSAIGTGITFTTPSISSTTTYYVEAINGTCTSARIAVIATVNTSPTITSTTPATICSGDTFIISALGSAGTLTWYNVATGGFVQGTESTFSLTNFTTTATFYVQATNGSCQSVRTPVIVTVNQRPFNMVATGGSRCGTGTLTLSAAYTNGTINWYDAASAGTLVFTGSNFVTPSLTTTTTYYVEGVNGTCISTVRTAITATVNTIPTVTSTTSASRCGTGSIALNAASSIGTLVWYNVATGGAALATGTTFNTPSITNTTTYYVEASNGTCLSTRTAVIATIDVAQTITSTTPASRCNAGTVTLSAAATGGTLNWYSSASGGSILATGSNFTTPSINSTTNYYVEVTNGTCTSARTMVTASIIPVNAPTGNANQTFCNGETVGLIVTTSGTNLVWYNAASGGTVVPNGTALVSGTTYYASQNNGTCESTTRLTVTVTSGACLSSDTFAMKALKVYPNPTVDLLNVSYSDPISRVEMFNILGQQILSVENSTNEIQINMARYASGTYLLKVFSAEMFKTVKIIKK